MHFLTGKIRDSSPAREMSSLWGSLKHHYHWLFAVRMCRLLWAKVTAEAVRHNSMAFSKLTPLHASAAGVYAIETTRTARSFVKPHFSVPLASEQKSGKRSSTLLGGHCRSLPTVLFCSILFCSFLFYFALKCSNCKSICPSCT